MTYVLVGLGSYILGALVMTVLVRWLLKRDGYR